MSDTLIVDPPSGWKYGFPKPVPDVMDRRSTEDRPTDRPNISRQPEFCIIFNVLLRNEIGQIDDQA